jgi:hypothetical protein
MPNNSRLTTSKVYPGDLARLAKVCGRIEKRERVKLPRPLQIARAVDALEREEQATADQKKEAVA